MTRLNYVFNKRIFKTCGAVALCILKFVVLMFLSSLLFGFIAQIICKDGFHLSKNLFQIISGDLSDIGIIILGYAYYKLDHEDMIKDCEIRNVSLKTIIKAFVMGICMVAVSSILNSIIMGIFHLQSENYKHVQEIYSMFSNNLWLMYSPIIIAPLCEEVLCRGMLFDRLQRIVNVKAAIIIQAIFFACLHGNTVQFGYTFLMGIIAGYLVYYTKSLIPSIIFHFANNLFAIIVVDIIKANNILTITYMVIAPILCIYLFFNIRKNSRVIIA